MLRYAVLCCALQCRALWVTMWFYKSPEGKATLGPCCTLGVPVESGGVQFSGGSRGIVVFIVGGMRGADREVFRQRQRVIPVEESVQSESC